MNTTIEERPPEAVAELQPQEMTSTVVTLLDPTQSETHAEFEVRVAAPTKATPDEQNCRDVYAQALDLAEQEFAAVAMEFVSANAELNRLQSKIASINKRKRVLEASLPALRLIAIAEIEATQ